tara:strand:- start:1184 stop:1837 length:654 start_codon:yes stop_codon:yes gene_type:complete
MAIGTTAALLSMAPSAISAAGRMLPTEMDRASKKRLAELNRLAEADALGLTETEQKMILSQARTAREGARRQQEATRKQQLAGFGAGSGEALSAALMQEEGRALEEQILMQDLAEKDLQKRAEQEQELADLAALRSQRQLERRAALADVAQAGADTILDGLAFRETVGAGSIGEGIIGARRAQLSQQFNIDENEAAEVEKYLQEHPEFLSEYIQGGG